MKILLNFSSIRKGGGIQVCLSLVEQLHHYPEFSWAIIYNSDIENAILKCVPSNVIHFKVEDHPLKISQRLSFLKRMKQCEETFLPDVVFSLFGPSYWTPKATHLEGFAVPHFVFEDSPYFKIIGNKLKLFHKISKFIKGYFLKREADYWVVENEAIINNLSKLLKVNQDRIFTVNNTCHQIFDDQHKWEQFSLPAKKEGTIRLICISAYYPHKNLEIIPRILEEVNLSYPELKIEFVTTLNESVYKRLNVKKYSNWINTGPIKIEACPSLYQQSDVLFLPTLLESFSASYVEAMKMKLPIITTNLSFAHSICGDAALYFEPLIVKSAIEKITLVEKNRNELIASGQKKLNEFGTAKTRLENYINILKRIVP